MQNRRKFLLTLTAGVVAMGFVVASVLADELLGVLVKVDVEGKKITVEEKGTDKEIELKITDDTEVGHEKGGHQSRPREAGERCQESSGRRQKRSYRQGDAREACRLQDRVPEEGVRQEEGRLISAMSSAPPIRPGLIRSDSDCAGTGFRGGDPPRASRRWARPGQNRRGGRADGPGSPHGTEPGNNRCTAASAADFAAPEPGIIPPCGRERLNLRHPLGGAAKPVQVKGQPDD